ncbi:MAG: SDR family oxidoreductase [Alphaproteobacteria bacterium]|nr:SDR family oxidoreductase [Alphaproteobacteria bacterium]
MTDIGAEVSGMLNGKTVIVTGAGGNLGAAVGHVAVEAGATVVLADFDAARIAACFPELAAPHRVVAGGNLTQLADCRDIVDACLDATGRVDGLVQCVGGFAMSDDFLTSTPEDFEKMMTLNLKTTETLCRAVLPMIGRQGSIVTVGAGAALAPVRGMGAYAASKAALITLTKTLATEMRANRVRVNCVLPSIIDTPENRKAMPKADPAEWITPAAIAETICFLLSDRARTVTGALIPVDLPD